MQSVEHEIDDVSHGDFKTAVSKNKIRGIVRFEKKSGVPHSESCFFIAGGAVAMVTPSLERQMSNWDHAFQRRSSIISLMNPAKKNGFVAQQRMNSSQAF
jgi:hypothetical protein